MIKAFIEWLKARLRGERLVGSMRDRGRIYEKADPGGFRLVTKGRMTVRAKIERADGSTEDLGVISRS